MEKVPGTENGKEFHRADLSVIKMMGMKFMINFFPKNDNQRKVYDQAIKDVCSEHKLNPFHQINVDEESAWEMWAEVDKEALEALFPEIHVRAEELHRSWVELDLI